MSETTRMPGGWALRQWQSQSTSGLDAAAIGVWLALPCLLFCAFIGNVALGLGFAAVLMFVLPAFRTIAEPHAPAVTLACALAAVTLTTLGGEGRLVGATLDWLVRDAVLHDLVAQPWPFVYRFDGADWLLRAPLGMYLLPAAVGKVAGQYAATLALWLQNTLALFGILRILCSAAPAARGITVLLVFCVFSGWDVPGALVTNPGAPLPDDIGWWAGAFQYSSTMTLAFWVPNHALAGWAVAALLLLWDTGRIRIGVLMMGTALSIFWSPFALMGAVPFVLKAGVEALARRQIGWRDVALPALFTAALVPLVAYLTSDSAAVPHGFQPLIPEFGHRYAAFIIFELLPFMLINVLFGEAGGFAKSTYLVAVASLILIPFYRMGAANDFVMRASIPALAVVAVTTGHTAYAVLRDGRAWKIAVVGIVVTLGALTGVSQLHSILHAPNNGTSTCDLIEAWDQDPIGSASKAHYLVDVTHLPALLQPHRAQPHPTGPTKARCVDQRLKR